MLMVKLEFASERVFAVSGGTRTRDRLDHNPTLVVRLGPTTACFRGFH
jgi:hypothetical protein